MQLHTYCFVLEVSPLEVGSRYNELPAHCTLMHRFRSGLDVYQITESVNELFSATAPIDLHFGGQEELGPKSIIVNRIQMTKVLSTLHQKLYAILNELGVVYTAHDWVGEGYIAHVSRRPDSAYKDGGTHVSKAAYLVEVKVSGSEGSRFVRSKFVLG